MIFISLLIWSCAKEEKGNINLQIKDELTELRSPLDCGPNTSQSGCISYPYSGITVPTFKGCDAVASYSVQICYTTSVPIKVSSIAIYDLDIQFAANCTVLTDSIFYYIANSNFTRADYLLKMFNK